jgi:hypothetical protein
MKKLLYPIILIFLLSGCKDDDIAVFDKTADERAAEAIASLKADLIAPTGGWKLKYQPEPGSGAFWILLTFRDDNTVTIKSDIPDEEGAYYEKTVTYRIDSSLGIELVLENYSFFSFLFEQDQATFGAEFEFVYVNKTPDGALVFRSKTDFVDQTILTFLPASAQDEELLGEEVAENLQQFPSSARIVFTNKDLAIYLSLDVLRRNSRFNYISLKSNLAQGQALEHNTGYIIRGDSMVFLQPLSYSFNGQQGRIKGISLDELGEVSINVCPQPTNVPAYTGILSTGDAATLETSLFNYEGASFRTRSSVFFGHLLNIRDENGQRVNEQIGIDVKYAGGMLLYNEPDFTALGFYIENPDGSTAIVVREYSAVYTGNIVEFTFAPNISVFRQPDPETNINNIDIYLNLLAEGGKAYVYRLDDQFYEFYNPCSGWRFVFQAL